MGAYPQRQPDSMADAGALQWHEGEMALPESFRLQSGAVLRSGCLAWQWVGPENAPLIIVLGGISAHRACCALDGDGWWESQCGAGRTLDTAKYRLLGVDWLGGAAASSGVEGAAISSLDQACALLLLINRLGVRRVHLIVGASYGGAVAQHLAVLLGTRLRHLLLLCAAHRSSAFALALRHVQRAILDLGGNAPAALSLARQLAILGYLTSAGIQSRFDAPAQVLPWLAHHGDKFAAHFDADAYRCLGASLDTHSIDPATIRVPTTLFSVHEDLLIPPVLALEFAERCGAACELVAISSACGHDAFLKEDAAVADVLRAAVEDLT